MSALKKQLASVDELKSELRHEAGTLRLYDLGTMIVGWNAEISEENMS